MVQLQQRQDVLSVGTVSVSHSFEYLDQEGSHDDSQGVAQGGGQAICHVEHQDEEEEPVRVEHAGEHVEPPVENDRVLELHSLTDLFVPLLQLLQHTSIINYLYIAHP